MHVYKFIACALITYFTITHGTSAQVAQRVLKENAPTGASLGLDLNTPTAPGFVVIGASPKNVADPGNIKQLAVETAGFVEDGKLKPGLAISAQPFWIFNQDLTLETYANSTLNGASVSDGYNPWQRAMARTQVSLATVEAESTKNKNAIKLGLGLQTELLDGRDPRNIESAICMISAWQRYAKGPAKALQEKINEQVEVERNANLRKPIDQRIPLDELSEPITKKAMKAFKVPAYIEAKKRCEKKEELRFLRSPSWMIGAGAAGQSDAGKIDDLELDGASFWSTYRKPFGTKKAFVIFAKVDVDRDFKVAPNTMAKGNAIEAAISYALEEPSWKLDATASVHYRDFKVANYDDDHFQFSITGAYKLKEGVWFEATAGTKANSNMGDENFGLIQIKTNLGGAVKKLVE